MNGRGKKGKIYLNTLAANSEESKQEECFVYYHILLRVSMRLKSGQKEYSRKVVAAHIKVAYCTY